VGPRRRRFRPAGGTGVSDQREHEHGDSRNNALIIGSVVAAGQSQPLIDVGHQLGVPLADPGPLGVIVSRRRVEFGEAGTILRLAQPVDPGLDVGCVVLPVAAVSLPKVWPPLFGPCLPGDMWKTCRSKESRRPNPGRRPS
jgi:hypothetical protein